MISLLLHVLVWPCRMWARQFSNCSLFVCLTLKDTQSLCVHVGMQPFACGQQRGGGSQRHVDWPFFHQRKGVLATTLYWSVVICSVETNHTGSFIDFQLFSLFLHQDLKNLPIDRSVASIVLVSLRHANNTALFHWVTHVIILANCLIFFLLSQHFLGEAFSCSIELKQTSGRYNLHPLEDFPQILSWRGKRITHTLKWIYPA